MINRAKESFANKPISVRGSAVGFSALIYHGEMILFGFIFLTNQIAIEVFFENKKKRKLFTRIVSISISKSLSNVFKSGYEYHPSANCIVSLESISFVIAVELHSSLSASVAF